MGNNTVTVECNGCGCEIKADKTRGMGPCHAFDVAHVFLRAYLGEKIVGSVKIDRAAADKGGTLEERLAGCVDQSQARGMCLGCLAGVAVRRLNDMQLELGDNQDASVRARLNAARS